MKTLKFLRTAAAVFALTTGFAQATLVTQWAVTDTAVFQNAVGATTVYNGGMSIDWGTSTGFGPSGLDITNLPPGNPYTVFTDGPTVNTIAVTHRNQPITGSSLDTVEIKATLQLTPLLPAGPAFPSGFVTFLVNFQETPNLAAGQMCANGGISGVGVNSNSCADIFVIDDTSVNFPFFYDDQWYFVSFDSVANGFHPLSAAACLAAGAAVGCRGFETPEGANTTVPFGINISTVPEPGSVALMGLALASLGWVGRRRRQQ